MSDVPFDPDNLIYIDKPVVKYASNIFIEVPTILQYENTPLIELVKVAQAGFTTEFSIYNSDGIYLAKVKGSQLYLTDAGKKSNLKVTSPDKKTVCTLNDQVLFEVERDEAAALKTTAELFTPDGYFVRHNELNMSMNLIKADDSSLQIGTNIMSGNMIRGANIGVHIHMDGSLSIGVL